MPRKSATPVSAVSARAGPASDSRLLDPLDAIGDGAWSYEVATARSAYSRAWLEARGVTPDEARPVGYWEEFVHPEDLALSQDCMSAHLEGLTRYYECEYRIRLADGEYHWILDRGRVVERGEHGVPLRAVGVNFDITDRKRAELVLDVAQRRAQAMIESSACAVVCLDAALRILEWNAGAEQLTGRTRTAVHGKHFLPIVVSRERHAQVEGDLRDVLGGLGSRLIEIPVANRGGIERPVLWNVSPLVASAGSSWGVIAVGFETTPERGPAGGAPPAPNRRRPT